MKRKVLLSALSLLLVLVMMFSITACTKTPTVTPNTPDDKPIDDPVKPNDPVEEKPYEDENMYYWYPVISDEMPIIRINTDDGSNAFATNYNRDNKVRGEIDYVSGNVSIENCEEEYILTDIKTQVKVRGNYTLNYAKKPLRLKLDKKQNLLGLHDGEKFKNWVLLADVKDLSMSNNATAFYLAKTILGSNGYYSTDFRNVEVYLNGEYWGVYLLVEQQEVKEGDGSNRTSVPEVEDDYKGTDIGYFVEYDAYYTEERALPDGDPTFELSYDGNTEYTQRGYTVKSDINDQAQLNFIQKYLNNVYAIANRALSNRFYEINDRGGLSRITETDGLTAQSVISKLIDVQSLVDMYILNEIVVNPDIDWSSFYISVDMSEKGNKKLVFEAPWDYDSALGIRPSGPTEISCENPNQMYVAKAKNPWLNLLLKADWFQDLVKEKWKKLKDAEVPETALQLIQEQSETYQAYYIKNYERWPNLRNESAWGELNGSAQALTNQKEAADYLYNWLEQRFNYLDKQWK